MFFDRKAVRRTVSGQIAGIAHTGKPKRIANNTIEYVTPTGERHIRHHLTDIIRFHKSGAVTITTEGHLSVTTKARLNEFVPGFRVWGQGGWQFSWAGKEYPYSEPLTLYPSGKVKGVKAPKDRTRDKTAIAKFLKAAAALPELPKPSPGDCWLCSLETPAGKTLGEMRGAASNSAHVVEHVREGYLHGSLIVRALEHCGYRKEQIPFVWTFRSSVLRALRRYVKAAYGIA